MLISTMTLEEAYAEYFRDLPAAQARGVAEFTMLKNEVARKHLPQSSRLVDYLSSHRNRWLILVSSGHRLTVVRGSLFVSDEHGAMSYQNTNGENTNGIRALVVLTAHFYRRLNERLQLGIARPEKIVRHFMKTNLRFDYVFRHGVYNDRQLAIVQLDGGAGLGYRTVDMRFVIVKTFVAEDMMRDNQHRLLELVHADDPTATVRDEQVYTKEQVRKYLS